MKFNIRWGYNNVWIKEGNQWKAAFKMNRGLFEPTVMFFGLTNSPATFQTMMDAIFREEIAKGDVLILLRADYVYRCRQIDSLLCAQLHGDKYFTLVRAAYT